MNTVATIFNSMNTPDGKPTKEMLERWKAEEEDCMEDTPKTACGKPDYEDMYNKLYKEHAKLTEETEYLRANLREAGEQCNIMRAQLDMVHLIFGRNH